MDDDIMEHLKKDFPDFDPAEPIDEDKMKSKAGKDRWRPFMMAYEKKIDDYNFGTMMRTDPKLEYGRDETIFGRWLAGWLPGPGGCVPGSGFADVVRAVPRMQFYAIEIAR